MINIDLKSKIKNSINSFRNGILFDNAIQLFNTLGYDTSRQARLDRPDFKCFEDTYLKEQFNFSREKALTNDWIFVDIMFQLSKEEMKKNALQFEAKRVDNTIIESYLFIAIELRNDYYTRTQLSQITREVNKLFSMPVMLLFKYGNAITLSVIDRRINKKDDNKDVLEKITLIKDINIESPHRAHIEILNDLAFNSLNSNSKFSIINFVELHKAWQRVLDTKELNKKFYSELSAWYYFMLCRKLNFQ